MIYLDHALFSPTDDQWCAASAPYCSDREVDLAPLYELVGAEANDHFVFTSSGAEAINQVVFGTYVDVTRQSGRHHYLCSSLDEAPAILSMTRLEALGCHFQMVKATADGVITTKEFSETLTPRTALLSLSWAGGLTGVIQPLQEIAALCEERGILLHIDATHVIGKGHFLFKESGAHFLTFDGSPLGAPEGTGGLFIKEGVELSPLIMGGKEQQSMRGGFVSRRLQTSLIDRAKQLLEERDLFCMQAATLRMQFEEGLADVAEVMFKEQHRVPHITLLGFKGVESEALAYVLSQRKVYGNRGGGQFQQLMHLLKSCHIATPLCHSCMSFAIGPDTTEAQVEIAIKQIKEAVSSLQALSKELV